MGDHVARSTDLVSKVKAVVTGTSPKVKAGFIWGVAALLAMAVLDGITPEMFATLGPWETMARNVATVLASLLGGWLKSDPLRDLGATVVAEEIVDESPAE